jgi:hypothetical protein
VILKSENKVSLKEKIKEKTQIRLKDKKKSIETDNGEKKIRMRKEKSV